MLDYPYLSIIPCNNMATMSPTYTYSTRRRTGAPVYSCTPSRDNKIWLPHPVQITGCGEQDVVNRMWKKQDMTPYPVIWVSYPVIWTGCGHILPMTGYRPPKTGCGHILSMTGCGPPKTGCGKQDMASRIWRAGYGEQDVASRMWRAGCGEQDMASRMWCSI